MVGEEERERERGRRSNNPAVCNNERRMLSHERASARARARARPYKTTYLNTLNSSLNVPQQFGTIHTVLIILSPARACSLVRGSRRRHIGGSIYHVLIISSDWTRLMERENAAVGIARFAQI